MHLIVKDNGRGLGRADSGVLNSGRGLAGIDARVRDHDGRLRIQSGPQGTILHIAIPTSTPQGQPTTVAQ